MTKFIFLIVPKTHLLDLAGPDQVILESIGYGADFCLEYCSYTDVVATSTGMPLGKLPHFTKMNIKANDYLIIPGCDVEFTFSAEIKNNKPLLSWIKNLHASNVNICSICTGAFILALTGLLNDVPCTTHFKRTQQLQQCFPSALVRENILFTEHNNIFTSAGIVSGIDMMLHIVEKLKGTYFAHKVARELVMYNRRNGNQQQHSELLSFRNHVHAGIHNVQDWLHHNLHKPTKLLLLAEIANMSERNFTRTFKRETGTTVNKYITTLRKERMIELMKNADITRHELAKKCGLTSIRQVQRILELGA